MDTNHLLLYLITLLIFNHITALAPFVCSGGAGPLSAYASSPSADSVCLGQRLFHPEQGPYVLSQNPEKPSRQRRGAEALVADAQAKAELVHPGPDITQTPY